MTKFFKTQLTVASLLVGALALGTGCKTNKSAERGTEPMPPATDYTGTDQGPGQAPTETGTPPPSSGGSGYEQPNPPPPPDTSGMGNEPVTQPPSSLPPDSGGSGANSTGESEPGVHHGDMNSPSTGGSGQDMNPPPSSGDTTMPPNSGGSGSDMNTPPASNCAGQGTMDPYAPNTNNPPPKDSTTR
ncbi:hypothetical protein JGU66_06160 [Myxococcaceae bacterium JPH2]|nr:hypothetical protein [Myxococcaceae bacterium JPH2]